MRNLPIYSTYFSCLYDEQTPVGHLGRGTHYSVMRSVEWLDVERRSLKLPQVHDFAVIWDEDHDERVVEAVERIYMAGLLSPVQFIGERKGGLTVIVASRFWYSHPPIEGGIEVYKSRVEDALDGMSHGDYWPVTFGMFDRAECWPPHQTEVEGLINDGEYKVITYLRNIDSLWNLGTKKYVPPPHFEEDHQSIVRDFDSLD